MKMDRDLTRQFSPRAGLDGWSKVFSRSMHIAWTKVERTVIGGTAVRGGLMWTVLFATATPILSRADDGALETVQSRVEIAIRLPENTKSRDDAVVSDDNQGVQEGIANQAKNGEGVAVTRPAVNQREPKKADGEAEVRFKSVVSAETLINRHVEDVGGVLVGTVFDVVIDQEFGKVAFVAVNSRRAGNTLPKAYFVPPSAIDSWTDDKRLRLNVSWNHVEHFQTMFDKVQPSLVEIQNLAKLYKHFEAEPYWPENRDKNQRLSLITVDEIDGRIVRDDLWNQLGRIQEVLLAPERNWRVAYLTVGELNAEDSGTSRIAIPMAAFALKSISPTWLLDVPENSMLLKQTFEAGKWPLEIDRGWIEFTHVKYGSAALDGLQKLDQQTTTEIELVP